MKKVLLILIAASVIAGCNVRGYKQHQDSGQKELMQKTEQATGAVRPKPLRKGRF